MILIVDALKYIKYLYNIIIFQFYLIINLISTINIMAKLNTGWKHWDMHLSKFVDKKINCLDIGSYTGASTCWMLNNLCQNPYSRVYSVDTWEGSAEYTEYTNEIEQRFDSNVEKTLKQNQNIKIKMTSTKALLKFNISNEIIFDFIFIDASHEAKDVLSDAILSWNLLNNEGILIFDDYKWDKLKEEYFRPKIAIDSFVSIYKPQLKTLYIGYQYIIEKINQSSYEKPELDDYYKLLNEINFFKIYNIIEDIVFENEIIDELNIKLNILNNTNSNSKFLNLDNYYLLSNIYNFDNDTNILLLYNKLINKYSNIDSIKDLIINLNLDLNYFFLNNIIDFDLIKKYSENKKNIFILYYVNYNIKNNDRINIELKKNIVFNNDYINYKEYDELINKNKYDLLYFGQYYNRDKSFNISIKYYLLYCIGIALNTQNINGNLIIVSSIEIDNDLLIDSIYILKKYYKKIIIKNKKSLNLGTSFYIIANDFIGINEKDKININLFIKNLNNKVINNINILYNKSTDYITIKEKINEFINIKNSNCLKMIDLYKKINNYIITSDNDKYNSNIKIYLFKLLLNNLLFKNLN